MLRASFTFQLRFLGLLSDCQKEFRQIIIKDHGRKKPTFVITNNEEISISKILEVYAKRWRIENKFSVKIRKRAYTAILKNVEKLNKHIKVPWLGEKTAQIIWTA